MKQEDDDLYESQFDNPRIKQEYPYDRKDDYGGAGNDLWNVKD